MGIRRSRTQDGFTLTEVLMAASILVVISAIMLSFLTQGLSLWQLITSQSDLRSTARNVMSYMTQELRKATRTSKENPPPNLTIPSKPNNNSVDFYLPADLDGNRLIIDATGATEWDKSNKIQYQYIPGLKRLRRLEKGKQYVISDNVTSIEFEDNSINSALYDNELKIILTLQTLVPPNRTVSVTLTSIVKLRNQ